VAKKATRRQNVRIHPSQKGALTVAKRATLRLTVRIRPRLEVVKFTFEIARFITNLMTGEASGGASRGCFRCGKEGHSKADCPEPEKCFNCGGEGHTSKECSEELKTRTVKVCLTLTLTGNKVEFRFDFRTKKEKMSRYTFHKKCQKRSSLSWEFSKESTSTISTLRW